MANCSFRTKKHSREAIYWQLRISNGFVTFRYQFAPAVTSHFRCVRQPRAAMPDHRADAGFWFSPDSVGFL